MNNRFFELAKKSSKHSKHSQHKVGAVLVKKNRIVSVGFNKPLKTHPLSKCFYNTIHAELDAILKVSRDRVEGCSIYVYREDFFGKPKIAKPCEHCERLLRDFKIKKVYYTINDGSDFYRNTYE